MRDIWKSDTKDFLSDPELYRITKSHHIDTLTSEVKRACRTTFNLQHPSLLNKGAWLVAHLLNPNGIQRFYMLGENPKVPWLSQGYSRHEGSNHLLPDPDGPSLLPLVCFAEARGVSKTESGAVAAFMPACINDKQTIWNFSSKKSKTLDSTRKSRSGVGEACLSLQISLAIQPSTIVESYWKQIRFEKVLISRGYSPKQR